MGDISDCLIEWSVSTTVDRCVSCAFGRQMSMLKHLFFFFEKRKKKNKKEKKTRNRKHNTVVPSFHCNFFVPDFTAGCVAFEMGHDGAALARSSASVPWPARPLRTAHFATLPAAHPPRLLLVVTV